ncbi:hypothetical protein AAC387_Pa11g0472 [Persea americana]
MKFKKIILTADVPDYGEAGKPLGKKGQLLEVKPGFFRKGPACHSPFTQEPSLSHSPSQTGASQTVEAPAGWGGRMWGRTRCTTDTSGKFTCVTGDCGVHIPCNGAGPAPPATIVEFTLGTGGNKDFYDTSLVDGFNLPFSITPLGGTGNCRVSGCPADVNAICPPELRLTAPDGSTAGCKSACVAFGTEEYCCRGADGTPDKCKPTYYSMIFKNACRLAYSYAYDDASSIFTCTGANYLLTFCP